MPFSPDTIAAAVRRSGGRCECRASHGDEASAPHAGERCPRTFLSRDRYEVMLRAAAPDADTVEHALVICLPCHHWIATAEQAAAEA